MQPRSGPNNNQTGEIRVEDAPMQAGDLAPVILPRHNGFPPSTPSPQNPFFTPEIQWENGRAGQPDGGGAQHRVGRNLYRGARCGDRGLPFVATEHGKALDYLRRIKVALDPQGP